MRHRLVLGLAVVLAACSSGGGGGGPSVPTVPWGGFRHDNANSGAGNPITRNKAQITQLCSTTGKVGLTPCPGEITLSTPTVDRNGNVALGMSNGVVSFDGKPRCSESDSKECNADSCLPFGATCDTATQRCTGGVGPDVKCKPDTCLPNNGTCTGKVRWVFDQCELSGTSAPIPVGSVSASAAITPGNTLVFGNDATDGDPGHLFTAKEQHADITCTWVYPSGAGVGFGISSSAATQIYTLDLSLISAFVGADDGRLRVLNSDGTVRWTYPSVPAAPLTSTPALDTNNVTYVTTSDGVLSALNATGGLAWQFPLGIAPPAPLYPSPVAATTIFAVGAGGSVFGINQTGTEKWVFTPSKPISGSPAILLGAFSQGSTDVADTLVYVIDVEGRIYGLRDGLNGAVIQLQRCSGDPTLECTTDSCAPFGTTCDPQTNRCKGGVGPDQRCSEDSCVSDAANGVCMTVNGSIEIAGGPVPITTSPTVSSDQFAVVGTSDGRVCARTLDGFPPGYNLNPATTDWPASGCVSLFDDGPTQSSPSIGLNGEIYITTDAGLYVIK